MKTKKTIRNCAAIFRFQCPLLWKELLPTSSEGVRHCAVCYCDVFLCTTDEETIEHAKAGHCIARELPDEKELPRIFLGRPKEILGPTIQEAKASTWYGREAAINDSIKNADSDRSCPKCNYPAPRWRVSCRVCGFEMGRKLKDENENPMP